MASSPLEEKYDALLDLNMDDAHKGIGISIRRQIHKAPVMFVLETIGEYEIRAPITCDPTAIRRLVHPSHDAAVLRLRAFEMFPDAVTRLELAREHTRIYDGVVQMLRRACAEDQGQGQGQCQGEVKFIAVHGVLPLSRMDDGGVRAMWDAFRRDADQLPFSWAAIDAFLCKDAAEDADFHWKHHWRARRRPDPAIPKCAPQKRGHPLDVLNDWIEPMGLSFRNRGELCLLTPAPKSKGGYPTGMLNAAVFLTRDPVEALEFLGYDGRSARSIASKHHASDPAVLCSSAYFSPSVLRRRSRGGGGGKFGGGPVATCLQRYALAAYPDVYEAQGQEASPEQLRRLVSAMRLRAFERFPASKRRYDDALAETETFDRVFDVEDRARIDAFTKQNEAAASALPFDLRCEVVQRFYEFVYLNGLMPLSRLDRDELVEKWGSFRAQLLDDGLAPHDWVAARARNR